MASLTQAAFTKPRIKSGPCHRRQRLRAHPFAKGLVLRVRIMTPKKPNSALRHVAKVRVYRGGRIVARIPGSGFGVTKFNRVLIRGGRANDLPGIGYTLVRGVFDFPPFFGKKKARSKYGVARPDSRAGRPRRRLRMKGEV